MQNGPPKSSPEPHHWPYLHESQAGWLDPDRIAEQGRFLLYRALNLQQIVAFLGAGTSMAYGRISWSELAYKQATNIVDFYGVGTNRAHQEFDESEKTSNITKIVEILDEQRNKYENGSDIDQVFCLNICEQFWRVISYNYIDKFAKRLGIDKNFNNTTKPAAAEDYGRACFQLSVKHEAFDERRNIHSILRGKFVPAHRSAESLPLRQDLFTIDLFAREASDDDPPGYAVWRSLATVTLRDFSQLDRVHLPGTRQSAAFFQRDVVARQAAALAKMAASAGPDDWALQVASGLYHALAGQPDDSPLPPACYFMVGLALDLLRYQDAVKGNSRATGEWLEALIKEVPRKTLSRSEVIPKLYDPLYCLIQDLKIDRIATVNYDLEVERFLADSGYCVQDAALATGFASYERAGPLGARTRDIALDGDRAADLIDFAVSEDEYTVQVAHLHGRATSDSDLVVTERDYRNSYIHNGDVSDIYRQGLSILFGGNPVLFIGVGLNEEDLLRPLREFLSLEPDSNRPVLALMPALSSALDCRATTIKHFARYGIYVLHHGLSGEVAWLHQIVRLCKDICNILKDAKEATPPPNLEERHKKAQTDLSAITGLSFKTLDGGDDAANVDLSLELASIRCILDVTSTLLTSGGPAEHRNALLEALRNWTFSAESAVLTKSLCGALLGTRQCWEQWWKDWQRIPDSRHKALPFTNLPSKQAAGETIPPVIVRHYSIAPPVGDATPPAGDKPGTPNLFDLVPEFIITVINARGNGQHPPAIGGGGNDVQGKTPAIKPGPAPRGRQQVVLISGDKGAGKGLLFACLLGWINKKRPASHAGFFFAGFSFSCEVASVWDALICFIDPGTRPPGRQQPPPEPGNEVADGLLPATGDQTMSPAGAPSATQGEGQATLSPPAHQLRATRLAAALKKAQEANQRLLIVMNSIDMLFHRNGDAKNAEIHAIMKVLFGPEATAIDIVILTRTERCPRFLLPHTRGPQSSVRRYAAPIREVCFNKVQTLPWTGELSMQRNNPDELPAPPRLPDVRSVKMRDFANIHFKLEMAASENQNSGQMSVYSNYMLQLIENNIKNSTSKESDIRSKLDIGRLGKNHSLMRVFDYVTDYWYFSRISAGLRQAVEGDFKARAIEEVRKIETLVIAGTGGADGESSGRKLDETPFQDPLSEMERELAANAHLHEALIRHLAVISIPVPAIVLAECPIIQQIYKEKTDPAYQEKDRHWHASRRHLLVALALHIMVQVKGMVFCIDPVDTGSATSPDYALPRRYQVHRGLQHFVYNRLGAQVVEPVEGIFFTPSLPTSQARNMPQLNADAYIFLYELVHRLSGYPAAGGGDSSRAGVMAFNLRAAMGVVRTLLSFGTVCRFSNLQSLPTLGQGGIGQLERHRLLLRWMLVAATRCAEIRGGGTGKPAPPFYQDETAWLLNEIGVLSLIQGRCREADTFVSLAMNTSIAAEGGAGTMSRRMKLNRGLCAIDLGRLTAARQWFDQVRYQDDEELLLRTLAEGYTAQVEHLCGNYVLAETQYGHAIQTLQELEHTRPISYLRRAEADLFRRVGRIEEAKQALEDSLRIAEAGGFNDYYHFSQLSEVRLNLTTSAQLVDLLPTVDQAERYADRMDLPRLKIEALRTRAEVFLSQGETRLAGDLAASAMRLAKLNDLVLRRISLTELMSRIFRRRGNLLAADRMQSLAERSARRVGYHMPGSKPR